MNPRLTNVRTRPDYKLELTFDNGECKEFDVSPYLAKGIFQELKDESYFARARASLGTVAWPNGQDFCPDTLFEKSVRLSPI